LKYFWIIAVYLILLGVVVNAEDRGITKVPEGHLDKERIKPLTPGQTFDLCQEYCFQQGKNASDSILMADQQHFACGCGLRRIEEDDVQGNTR
jgi:hypothetical protein